jgi:phage gp16-like protein
LDNVTTIQATTAKNRQVKNVDARRRSVTDSFIIAIFKLKAKSGKIKAPGASLSAYLLYYP